MYMQNNQCVVHPETSTRTYSTLTSTDALLSSQSLFMQAKNVHLTPKTSSFNHMSSLSAPSDDSSVQRTLENHIFHSPSASNKVV